jgi:hypothetical protein
MNLEQISYVKECLNCQDSLGIRETYMWMNKNPFLANAVPMASKHIVASMKLSRIFLDKEDECISCNNKISYAFRNIEIGNKALLVEPSNSHAVVRLAIEKKNGNVSIALEPLKKGTPVTKFVIKSFYDAILKALEAVDARLFFEKDNGKFYSIVYFGPDSSQTVSLNDLSFFGFSKEELINYVSQARNNYMVSAGIDKYQY